MDKKVRIYLTGDVTIDVEEAQWLKRSATQLCHTFTDTAGRTWDVVDAHIICAQYLTVSA